MTDRRNRPIIRCGEPSCVSVGHWQASRGYCPVHYRELVAAVAAAVERTRSAQPRTRLDIASAALGGVGAHPKGIE